MRISIGKARFLLVLLSIPSLLLGQTTTTQKAFSPRQFVEGFYRWYLPIILNPQTGTASDVALKYKASAFSPELLRLLKADSAAQAGCEDLIGLDFDPFLYTQDSEGHYEVGKITQTGQSYRAEIYGVRSGVRFDKPSVIAEFTVQSGHWFFVNFIYPEGSDLLTTLRSEEKCSSPRPPGKK